MTTSPRRRCAGCQNLLPDRASPRRRWCTEKCRKATTRRQAAQDEATARWAEATARQKAQLTAAETVAGQRLAAIEDRDRTIAALKVELAAERRRAAEAMTGQLNRSAVVRDRYELSTVQVAELRTQLATAASPGEVATLRDRLAGFRTANNRLSEENRAMAEALQRAVTERTQLQTIVRQWDTLCRRLKTATGGRPANPTDQKILATWTRFRSTVATGHARPAGPTGQEATA